MDSVKDFVRRLESKCGEDYFPSGIADEIWDFEVENEFKFSHIYIGFAKDSSWSDHGYIYYDYECTRSYEFDELPSDLDKDMVIAGVYYDDTDNSISIDFFGDGTPKSEKLEMERYNKYWNNVFLERQNDVEYMLRLRDLRVSTNPIYNRGRV